MALKRITAPTTYPVTLAEAKLHCRVDSSDDDLRISAFISAATEMAEQKIGRSIMAQTWELSQDAFDYQMVLTRVPVQSITTVKYYDTNGAQQTLSGAAYQLYNSDDFGYATLLPVYETEWPVTRIQPDAVTVRYVSGFADAASVPEPIKTWIIMAVATMYENRASVSDERYVVDLGFVDRLLDRYVVSFA